MRQYLPVLQEYEIFLDDAFLKCHKNIQTLLPHAHTVEGVFELLVVQIMKSIKFLLILKTIIEKHDVVSG